MSPVSSTQPRTVALPVEFFTGLRLSALAASGPTAVLPVDAIRDAGYAAGAALYGHFANWLAEQGEAHPDKLSDERFPWLLEAFFHGIGWGRVELRPLSDAVMALDVSEWGEATDAAGGCLVTTGLFAGFFGRLAEAPISVLEVDGAQQGPGRSRFLLGSVDVMGYVWEAMERGIAYDRAAASA
ncbi:hypothetical protein [Gemmatimonas sp.]|jgi:hypothetical protein|uniref:hypothetical protein n=1 Tax=Gemmatimonas sp. TaxID=1962908 RepID=UPI0031C8CF57|nr:hypothetical protein [Gemmatimonas sp.]